MQVQFWGTRGSLAKPGPDTVRYGGNTSCVAIRSSGGTLIVIDCGTGAHGLGQSLVTGPIQPIRGHLLISHTHWDHIQGIPFFAPLFVPGNKWDIYAPQGLGESIRETLAGQMQYTYFPITLESLGADITYHDLVEGEFKIGDVTVRTRYLNHPALTLGYRLESNGVSVVYACDHEPSSQQPSSGESALGAQDQRHADFLRDADLVIHDAQYTETEFANKIGWGHSTAKYAADISRLAGVKRLALTHHDPLRTDDQIDRLVMDIRDAQEQSDRPLDIFAAAEGETIAVLPSPDTVKEQGRAEFSSVASVAPALSDYSILLGATDETTAEIILSATDKENILVERAMDTEAALSIIKNRQPSLVFLDGQSTALDIMAIGKHLKALATPENPQSPIVIFADNERESGDLVDIATDWMIRPFSEQYARTRIRAWLLRTTCRWVRAQLPDNESLRLDALHNLKILDTPPEERFDRITRIASNAFDVEIALVSLVDADRQWFKSCVGLNTTQTPRDMAFCAHAITESNALVVPDTHLDPRFADNPLVTGEPYVRFYAGCPLELPNGFRVGTLCLIDFKPRQLDDKKLALLKDLEELVVRELVGESNES